MFFDKAVQQKEGSIPKKQTQRTGLLLQDRKPKKETIGSQVRGRTKERKGRKESIALYQE